MLIWLLIFYMPHDGGGRAKTRFHLFEHTSGNKWLCVCMALVLKVSGKNVGKTARAVLEWGERTLENIPGLYLSRAKDWEDVIHSTEREKLLPSGKYQLGCREAGKSYSLSLFIHCSLACRIWANRKGWAVKMAAPIKGFESMAELLNVFTWISMH